MRLTKYQRKCKTLAKRLKPLTRSQREYCIANLPAFLVMRRGKLYCSECGSEVVDDPMRGANAFDCPECGHSYENSDKQVRAKKGVATEKYYYGVDTVCGGEQLKRHWMVFKTAVVGGSPEHTFIEVSRDFVSEDGKIAVQGLSVRPMTLYYDAWNFNSEIHTIDVKQGTNSWRRHDIDDWLTYPVVRKADWSRRRGYAGAPYFFGSLEWKLLLATDTFAEWLNKRGRIGWLDNARYTSLKQCKRELELCDKHGYEITDISLWLDMVETYRRCGMDTLNAKWSRPSDLQAAHDTAMRMDERRRIKEEQMKVVEKEPLYAKQKGRFFGIIITDGKFTARVIGSAAEMVEEGERMHHCVGTYIEKKDSLIFTVRDSCDRRVATVEWSIKRGQVMQCRGIQNSVPEGYDQIVQLVTSGKGLIEKANKVRKLKKVV